jgi:hypothetical protein
MIEGHPAGANFGRSGTYPTNLEGEFLESVLRRPFKPVFGCTKSEKAAMNLGPAR